MSPSLGGYSGTSEPALRDLFFERSKSHAGALGGKDMSSKLYPTVDDIAVRKGVVRANSETVRRCSKGSSSLSGSLLAIQ
jgi:hypothetical protein